MQRTLLTIVTEASLERRLIADIKARGAHGYTITEAHGEGSRGVRESGFEKAGNIRIEIVCEAAVAAAISQWLREHYYRDYAMILFSQQVEVLRPEKF
jgi:hypothetical protein